jgi:hypothetical protein
MWSTAQMTIEKNQRNTQSGLIENVGQIRDQYGKERKDIDFKMDQSNVTLFIGDGALHYQWQYLDEHTKIDRNILKKENFEAAQQIKVHQYRMDVTLLGANKQAEVIKESMLPTYQRYYLAHKGLNGAVAQAYNKITYKDIYPNIDWIIYTEEQASGVQNMKYDFVVHPGGNPNLIKLQYAGHNRLSHSSDGSLIAETPLGTVIEKAPYTYIQSNTNAKPTEVASAYKLEGNILSFNIAPYQGTLVIDPSVIWSTYFGGEIFDLGTTMTSDKAGGIFLVGVTYMSSNLATVGAHQTTNAGDFDGFIAKFDADGNRLWSTYYGGELIDYIFGAASNKDFLYLTGTTSSLSGIITPSSPEAVHNGGFSDFFVSKFSTDGVLIWGRYFGSEGYDYGGYCALASNNSVVLSGYSDGANFLGINGHQNNNGGGNDAVLAKFDSLGNLSWSTFYGGSGAESGEGVAVDRNDNIFLAGTTTSSTSISTTGSHQEVYGGSTDAYLAKFNASGVRQWATYYGGALMELNGLLNTLACNTNNDVIMAGSTYSTDGIASANAHNTSYNGDIDAYLVKFNADGIRQWGTYFGGSSLDIDGSMAIDHTNTIYWTGYTESLSNIVTPNAMQTNHNGIIDVFLTKFTDDGFLNYSTYFGGSNVDQGLAVGLDMSGDIYLCGGTESNNNISTPGSFQPVFGGAISMFLTKLCTAAPISGIMGSDTACSNTPITYTCSPLANATDYIWSYPPEWQGTSNQNSLTITTNGTSGTISVQIVSCDTSVPLTKVITVLEQPQEPVIIRNLLVLSTELSYQTYQWYLNGTAINEATQATYTMTENGDYTVEVSNGNLCSNSSEIYNFNTVDLQDITSVKNSIQSYPNPTDDKVFFASPYNLNIVVTSIDGKTLLTGNNTKSITLHALASGTYFIKIYDTQNTYIKTEKITKK